MARTARSIARSKQRKSEKATSKGWSGKGPSLMERLEAFMFDATKKYLKLLKKWRRQDSDVPYQEDSNLMYQEGLVDGIAHALVVFHRPYTDPDMFGQYVQEMKEEWVSRVKAVKKQGKQKGRRTGPMQMHW